MIEMNVGTAAGLLLAVIVVTLVLALWAFTAAYSWFWGAMSAKDRWLRNKFQQLRDDDESGYRNPEPEE